MQKLGLWFFYCLCFMTVGCESDPVEEVMPAAFHPPGIETLTEIDAADAKYGKESIVIQGVVSPGTQGGWTGKNEGYFVHCFSLAAWRKPGDPIRNQELTILRALPTNADYEEDFPEYTIQKIRVFLSEDRTRAVFESALLMEDSDEDLLAIAEEVQKPVILSTERFGKLTLDRSIDWFEGKAKWNEKTIDITFSAEPGEQKLPDQALQTAEQLWADQAEWNKKIEDYVIQELLELKNGTWLDEGEKEVTRQQFLDRMTLTSISIDPDGEFEFWYDDGDLFWGHSISVRGNLKDGLLDAGIQG